MACCMLKTPLKKVEKSCKMPFLFFMLNFSVYVLLVLFLYPIGEKRDLVYFDVGLGVASFFMWIFTAFTAPGFIKKPKNIDFLKLMQLIDPVQLCPDCEIVRTPRSRHCGTCNQCVERFDHHCPWINNCIGINNHKYFMAFISLLIVNIFTNFGLTVWNLIHMVQMGQDKYEVRYRVFNMPESIAGDHLMLKIMSVFVLLITGFFAVPVFVLMQVHIKNFCYKAK